MTRRIALSAILVALLSLGGCSDSSVEPDHPTQTETPVAGAQSSGSTFDVTSQADSDVRLSWVLVGTSEGPGLPAPQLIQSLDDYNLHVDQVSPGTGTDVDFARQVVMMLTVDIGAGCAETIELEDLLFQPGTDTVFGHFQRSREDPNCVGMLRSVRFFVAVDRAQLPTNFTLQSEPTLLHPQAVAVAVAITNR